VRVSGSESECECECEPTGRSHPAAGLDRETSCSHPLRKDVDQELTYGASHWRGENPQPRQGPGNGVPRLRDGMTGGDAGDTMNGVNLRGPLVGERQSFTPTVNHGSNVMDPEHEGQPDHQFPDSVSFTFRTPLLGEPAGRPDVNHPIFTALQPREVLSPNPPRGTGPLRVVPSGTLVSSDPDIWRKSCMSAAGIPQGLAVEGLSWAKLDTSVTFGSTPVAESPDTDETTLSVGQSRIGRGTTDGETSGVIGVSQTGRNPSERCGAARTNSVPIKAEPGVDSPKSAPMDAEARVS
jgi:hypothetical protein